MTLAPEVPAAKETRARDQIEGSTAEKAQTRAAQDKGGPAIAPQQPAASRPAAGPHAKPGLTDTEKTPGSGTLADAETPDQGDATTG